MRSAYEEIISDPRNLLRPGALDPAGTRSSG